MNATLAACASPQLLPTLQSRGSLGASIRQGGIAAIAALSCILASSPSQSFAEFFTGNDIHTDCSTNRDLVSGYVAGWLGKNESIDGMFTLAQQNPAGADLATISRLQEASLHACVPKEATVEQLVDIFCKSLAQTPETRHLSAGTLLTLTMYATFPCHQP